MAKYNNTAYKNLIDTIISDAFYTTNLSFDAKISLIRKYTEIILRRLLKHKTNSRLTIGDGRTIKKLKEAGYKECFFLDALEIIADSGNRSSHTQVLQVADESDYERVLQALLDIYGYMFYKYFKKYPFGSNLSIVTSFSMLPPVIRHITLTQLFNEDASNYLLAEKLLLATRKAYDERTAKEWLILHENVLKQIAVKISFEDRRALENKLGCEIANAIIESQSEKTAFDYLTEKLETLGNFTPLYKSFEEAVVYYRKNGIIEGGEEAVKEFNELMEFVYIGRREAENKIDNIQD